MRRAGTVLGSLLFLVVLLEAVVALPGSLLIKSRSADADTAKVTNGDLQGMVISDKPLQVNPKKKGGQKNLSILIF
jgi:hypothetical protein